MILSCLNSGFEKKTFFFVRVIFVSSDTESQLFRLNRGYKNCDIFRFCINFFYGSRRSRRYEGRLEIFRLGFKSTIPRQVSLLAFSGPKKIPDSTHSMPVWLLKSPLDSTS